MLSILKKLNKIYNHNRQSIEMINYNILGKLIDKVALNKWKNRVERINQEYHSLFVLDEHDIICTYDEDLCSNCSHDSYCMNGYSVYNYRDNFIGHVNKQIWSQCFIKCVNCDNVIIYSRMLHILHPDNRKKK